MRRVRNWLGLERSKIRDQLIFLNLIVALIVVYSDNEWLSSVLHIIHSRHNFHCIFFLRKFQNPAMGMIFDLSTVISPSSIRDCNIENSDIWFDMMGDQLTNDLSLIQSHSGNIQEHKLRFSE